VLSRLRVLARQLRTAAAALRARVRTRVVAVRDGNTIRVPIEEIVPGDVVALSAGSLVPADGVLLEATDLFVTEAVLTGESFPVEKRAEVGGLATEPAPPRSAARAPASRFTESRAAFEPRTQDLREPGLPAKGLREPRA
jgi:magnesium-transporting ATPase (P-type)